MADPKKTVVDMSKLSTDYRDAPESQTQTQMITQLNESEERRLIGHEISEKRLLIGRELFKRRPGNTQLDESE